MPLKEARKVLQIEADGILKMAARIDSRFKALIDLISCSTGRLVVSGIGKSGNVGRKIVATLNSTGTRALFLHPVEAMHGDLGQVCREDIFIALSNSGETEEINSLLPVIEDIGCKIIAFTGNLQSTLAQSSEIVIDVGVEKEADALGLAPTASTTALLAMGDALAVVLSRRCKFKRSDFRKFHPGGILGQRLCRLVDDLMLRGNALPVVHVGDKMTTGFSEINRCGLGSTLVLNPDATLAGIITDGDIRRMVSKKGNVHELSVEEVMTPSPLTVKADMPAYDALALMEKRQITVLPVAGAGGMVMGILHLHDILGKGAFAFNPASERSGLS